MTSAQSRRRHAKAVADDYLNLVMEFPLRPIQSNAEFARAMKVYLPLAMKGTREPPGLTPGETDYLAGLDVFIRQYEAPALSRLREAATPLALLKSLMQEAGMTSADLGDLISSRPGASMILKGKRQISRSQAKVLARRFGVDAGALL